MSCTTNYAEGFELCSPTLCLTFSGQHPKDDHELKVADFGFAAIVTDGCLSTQCGTPNYVAPEILENKQYGCAVDMWSLGVLTFVLLGMFYT